LTRLTLSNRPAPVLIFAATVLYVTRYFEDFALMIPETKSLEADTMLTLDIVPDTIASKVEKLDLDGTPNVADLNFWRTEGAEDYAVWPAHVGEKHICVLVNVRELSALSGEPYAFNTRKISLALKKFRALIERRAGELLVEGAAEVRLELGSLRGTN
jgi:hypothetical protein